MDPSPVYANIEKECNFNLHTLKSAKNVDEILEKQTIALKEADRSAAFYHFNLSREKAEELLFQSNQGENLNGKFLVRKSRNNPSDEVISIVLDKNVLHFQIRHKFDNCFQIDDGPIMQGIDNIIKHHKEKKDGLPCTLTDFVRGYPLPDTLRCQGQTNLLHMAVAERNKVCVIKILNSPKCPNINSRNADGDTALHIACHTGDEAIVKVLLKHAPQTNIKNQHKCTPLQLACHHKHCDIISELIVNGCCDPHVRCNFTGFYPLHEAAKLGHHKCIKVLLQNYCPPFPRTLTGETPLDIASERNHTKCIKLLESYTQPATKTHSKYWLHPELQRQGVITLLKRQGLIEGMFLIRKNKWHEGWFVISICHNSHIFHYAIQKCEYRKKDVYFIDNGPYLSSLEHLVHHYNIRPDGLPCRLKTGLAIGESPYPIPLLNPFVASIITDLPESPRSPAPAINFPNAVKISAPTRTPPPVPSLPSPQLSVPAVDEGHSFISFDRIKLGGLVGEGEFGKILKGTLTVTEGKKTKKITVALKYFTEDIVNCHADFYREAKIMLDLNHVCITKLIGICKNPLMLVEEFISKGSMLDFLIDYASKIDVNTDLILWASQIVAGMLYLESKKMVHRDLAARNILLESKKQIKITDFGLSRAVGEKHYYRATTGGKWPIKWYAMESVKYGHFSHASDVWSFGVTLWEMFSFGQMPYENMMGVEVIQFLENGQRLAQPKKCPHAIYKTMEDCWKIDIKERLTFTKLHKFFTEDIKHILK